VYNFFYVTEETSSATFFLCVLAFFLPDDGQTNYRNM